MHTSVNVALAKHAPITNSAVHDAARSSVPKATEKATNWTLNLWKEWQQNRKDNGTDYPLTAPHLLTEILLNEWMCKFILEVRRKDGAEYPPNSLYQIASVILRHIQICTVNKFLHSASI